MTSGSSTSDPQSPPRPPRITARAVWAGVVLILIALVAGVLLGRIGAPAAASMPGETSAEAGFARDMQTHHNQAVEMSILIRDRTDDEEIRLLALDILTAQSQQAGQMFAWLSAWGLPQTGSEPEMAWMARPALDGGGEAHDGGHSGMEMGGTMPGFASPEQLQQLRDAEGVEAERLWLELMIAHHQGGIEMAQAVLERSDDPLVTPLATGAATLQQKEIDYMTELLEARS
jgi:uncharacterized protein (DUF305 family)